MATATARRGARATGSRSRPETRGRDSNDSRDDILDVATEEFADKGLSGARIDEIAERTETSKRMIYYHFASKEELYRAVLDREYRRIRASESALHLADLPPREALAELVRRTFDWHREHPAFVRLVMNENICRGVHLRQLDGIRDLNASMIRSLGGILDRGRQARVFRAGIDPVDLHLHMSALCFYPVSNRHSVLEGFGRDMAAADEAAQRREQVVDLMLRWCSKA